MLKLTIAGSEFFNDETQTFSTFNDIEIELEHSLLSLSKWESKFEIPFLSKIDKTPEQIIGYIEAMIITENFDTEKLLLLSQDNLETINIYINSKQSATTFGNLPERKGIGEIITSELIYFWMISFNIPFETQHWHLNRLFSLIRIANVKNSKPERMSRQALAMRNQQLNAQRKAELNTSG